MTKIGNHPSQAVPSAKKAEATQQKGHSALHNIQPIAGTEPKNPNHLPLKSTVQNSHLTPLNESDQQKTNETYAERIQDAFSLSASGKQSHIHLPKEMVIIEDIFGQPAVMTEVNKKSKPIFFSNSPVEFCENFSIHLRAKYPQLTPEQYDKANTVPNYCKNLNMNDIKQFSKNIKGKNLNFEAKIVKTLHQTLKAEQRWAQTKVAFNIAMLSLFAGGAGFGAVHSG